MAKGRDANREEFWRQAVQRRADSGLTVVDFCAREGLKPATFHYWQKEIRRRDDESLSLGTDPAKVPALAPVQLVDDEGGAASVEIRATNGYVVRVSEQATTEHVRRVLQAIGELS